MRWEEPAGFQNILSSVFAKSCRSETKPVILIIKNKGFGTVYHSFCRRFEYFVCSFFFFWTWLQVPLVLSTQEFIVVFCWIVYKVSGQHISVSLYLLVVFLILNSMVNFYTLHLTVYEHYFWVLPEWNGNLNGSLQESNFSCLFRTGKGDTAYKWNLFFKLHKLTKKCKTMLNLLVFWEMRIRVVCSAISL